MAAPSVVGHRVYRGVVAAVLGLAAAAAAGQGIPYPASALPGDEKPGSVLFFALYTSAIGSSATQNTRFRLTNTQSGPLAVRLLFVDGSDGSSADTFVCLAGNQTTSFLASDVDPGVTGYAYALAVDADGCPVSRNVLIGDVAVKLSSGHQATLPAVAAAALYGGTLAGCTASGTASLSFDGTVYSAMPRVLAVDELASNLDGNNTLLVLNRIGGGVATTSPLGAGGGALRDAAGAAHPFSYPASPGPQRLTSLSNAFPATSPVYTTVVPAGGTGWLDVASTADEAIFGAVLQFNANAGSSSTAFSGGHNLRVLQTTTSATVTVPVLPNGC